MPSIRSLSWFALRWACALGAAALPAASHAQGQYEVSFRLTTSESFVPTLGFVGPATVAWMTTNGSMMTGMARDQIGVDGSGAAAQAIWSGWGYESDYEFIGRPRFVDGQPLVTTFTGYVPGGKWAFLVMGIGANVPASGGEVHVEGTWYTEFEILPGRSAPIPGVVRMAAPGAPALAGASWVGGVDAASDTMNWSFQSTADGVGIVFSAALLQPLAPGLDVFTATPGTDGRLEIRVSNPTDKVIAGSFSARTYIDASHANLGDVPVTPVPEAPVWALQLLGAGLMAAGLLRRRRQA